MTVTNELKDKLKDLRPSIVKNAKALLGTGTLNTKHQDELRQLKSKAASAQAKVRSLHRALFDILVSEPAQGSEQWMQQNDQCSVQ